MISVIIATKHRKQDLIRCLKALAKSSWKDFEVIVIDQSTIPALASRVHVNIRYVHKPGSGKSNALNIATRIARGDILAFTDDDCIVSPHWLSSLKKQFDKDPNVLAVFGNTFPYRPKNHTLQVCPSVFVTRRVRIFKKPLLHSKYIGFGNNMAIRKTAFISLGAFKPWLGPGSYGAAAEDADLALRILISGGYVVNTPHAGVYHNKWLTSTEAFSQELSYARGEMACYSYYYFRHFPFAAKIVYANIRDSVVSIFRNVFPCIRFRSLYYEIIKALARLYGTIVGATFAALGK